MDDWQYVAKKFYFFICFQCGEIVDSQLFDDIMILTILLAGVRSFK